MAPDTRWPPRTRLSGLRARCVVTFDACGKPFARGAGTGSRRYGGRTASRPRRGKSRRRLIARTHGSSSSARRAAAAASARSLFGSSAPLGRLRNPTDRAPRRRRDRRLRQREYRCGRADSRQRRRPVDAPRGRLCAGRHGLVDRTPPRHGVRSEPDDLVRAAAHGPQVLDDGLLRCRRLLERDRTASREDLVAYSHRSCSFRRDANTRKTTSTKETCTSGPFFPRSRGRGPALEPLRPVRAPGYVDR
jgi:hypothetical protein